MERKMSEKGLYVGTGVGLILFALVGFFPGSLIGGVVGLKLSSLAFGSPVSSALLPRIIVAASMVAGILGAAVTFIVGSATAGWAAGFVLDAVKGSQASETAEVKAH